MERGQEACAAERSRNVFGEDRSAALRRDRRAAIRESADLLDNITALWVALGIAPSAAPRRANPSSRIKEIGRRSFMALASGDGLRKLP